MESRSPLRQNPSLMRLLIACGSSWAEDWMLPAIVAVHAYETAGIGAAGLAGVVRMMPPALAAPALGTLVDRWPRERVLTIAFVLQALACVAIAVSFFAGWPLWVLFVFLGIEGLVSIVIQPATAALVPWLAVSPAQLTSANAGLTFGRSIGVFIGPLTAGAVIAFADPGWAYLIAAGFMTFAALLMVTVRCPAWTRPRRDPEASFVADMAVGARVVMADRGVAWITAQLAAVQGLLRGVFAVTSVLIAVDLLHTQGSVSALLQASIGAGGAIAGALLVRRRTTHLAFAFTGGIMLRTVPFLAVAASTHLWTVMLLMVVNGMGNAAMLTGGQTLLQRLVPNDALGRTLGAVGMVTTLGIAIGSGIAPALLSHFGTTDVLIALGLLYPLMALIGLPAVRAAEHRATHHDKDLAILRRVPFLAILPMVSLDGISQYVARRVIDEGDVVIRQGEPGRRFYIVVSGQVRVDVDGLPIRMMGPSSSFGELALLSDQPRTATVTATERTELACLDREHFLGALSFDPAAGTRLSTEGYVMPRGR